MPLLSLGPAPREVRRAARASLGPQEIVVMELPSTTGELVILTDRSLRLFTWAESEIQTAATIDLGNLRQLEPTGMNPHLGHEFAFTGATGREVRFWLRKRHAHQLRAALSHTTTRVAGRRTRT